MRKLEGIERATIEIAYDNGMINRFCTQEQIIHNMYDLISTIHIEDKRLLCINDFLYNLGEETLNTLCCGEEIEIKQIVKGAPDGTDDLLNEIFSNV